MLEEAGQAHTVVGQMGLFANNDDVVFSAFRVEFDELLAGHAVRTKVERLDV